MRQLPVVHFECDIFITNEKSYLKPPLKMNSAYKEFSLEENAVKSGTLDWTEGTGDGTKKGMEEPIKLMGSYPVHWEEYSVLDDSNTGTFWYLVNQIK